MTCRRPPEVFGMFDQERRKVSMKCCTHSHCELYHGVSPFGLSFGRFLKPWKTSKMKKIANRLRPTWLEPHAGPGCTRW